MVLQVQRFITGMHYVVLEEQTIALFKTKKQRRVKVIVQGSETFHAAILPHKQIGHFIFISSKTLKKLGLTEGDNIEIELNEDTSKYQFPVPEATRYWNKTLKQKLCSMASPLVTKWVYFT